MNQDSFYGEVEGDAFFERNFLAFDPSDVSQKHTLRPNKASLYDFLVSQFNPRGLRVLEVGCAVGDLLYVLRERHGCDVAGVEASPKAAEVASKLLALEVEAAPFSKSHFFSLDPDNRRVFDLLILDDVIGWMDPENIPQVFGVLDWVLKEGGQILIRELDSDFPFRVKNHHYPDKEIYNYRYARGFSSFFLATGLYRKRAESVSQDPSLQRVKSTSSLSTWKDSLIVKVSKSLFPTVPIEIDP